MKRVMVNMMTLVRFWMRFRLVAIENMFMMLMKNTFRMIMVFMMFRTTNGSLTKLIGAGNRGGMVMRFMVKMSMINWWQRSLCNLINLMNNFRSIRRFILIKNLFLKMMELWWRFRGMRFKTRSF